jgi:hypothetical protein
VNIYLTTTAHRRTSFPSKRRPSFILAGYTFENFYDEDLEPTMRKLFAHTFILIKESAPINDEDYQNSWSLQRKTSKIIPE